jgi:DNA (cytosine-5)-methyltransferase 1
MKLKTVDLFSGCGGLTLGLSNAGFKIVAAIDNWQPTIEIYKKNFDHAILKLDLNDVKKSIKEIKVYKPDIIVGGPPCQDFSSAGNRDENGGRADLTLSFAKIITGIKPKFFLMENVDRILKSQKLPEAFKLFKKSGYGLSYRVLDASYCGAPQARKRFFLFGELGGSDNILDNYFNKNISLKQMTVRDYLGNTLETNYYYRHPRNYNRRGVYSIDEPSPTIRGVNRPIPKGYKGHPKDASAINEKVRPLTSEERAWIQTFPKNFEWVGKKTELEQIIGNAVPVKLAEFVGNCITEYLSDKKNNRVIAKATLF